MNRTIKDATVKRFLYDDHDQLRNNLTNFISAYNLGRRLKTLKGLTPYEFICKQWIIEPERFIPNAFYQMPGLNKLKPAALQVCAVRPVTLTATTTIPVKCQTAAIMIPILKANSLAQLCLKKSPSRNMQDPLQS